MVAVDGDTSNAGAPGRPASGGLKGIKRQLSVVNAATPQLGPEVQGKVRHTAAALGQRCVSVTQGFKGRRKDINQWRMDGKRGTGWLAGRVREEWAEKSNRAR